IRIFTPASELPFAGHPTLGTAFVLGLPLQLTEIRLETGAGVVPVRLERETELLAALGVERAELPVELYDNGVRHVFVALAGEDEVAALAPDLQALAQLGPLGVSCFAGSGTRWKT